MTKKCAPGDFAKSDPVDGQTGLRKRVTLSWDPSDGATGYSVCIEVSVTPDGVCNDFSYGPYSGTSVRFSQLPRGTTFEWDVRAENASGTTVAVEGAWSFQTR